MLALWFICVFVANAASAQTPVTHQMTAMSISREETASGTEELAKTEEASSASSPSGRAMGLAFAPEDDTDLGLSSKYKLWPLVPVDSCHLWAGRAEEKRVCLLDQGGQRESAVPEGRPVRLWAEG